MFSGGRERVHWEQIGLIPPLSYYFQNIKLPNALGIQVVSNKPFFIATSIQFKNNIKPFSTNVPLLYPLETSQNLRFSDVFRGYRSETLVKNGLFRTFIKHSKKKHISPFHQSKFKNGYQRITTDIRLFRKIVSLRIKHILSFTHNTENNNRIPL